MVAEPVTADPATSPDTQTPPPADTQDAPSGVVTDGGAAAQTGEPGGEPTTPAADPIGAKLQADAIEAARVAALEEGIERGKREALDEKIAASSQQTIAGFKNLYPQTVRAIRAELEGAHPDTVQRVMNLIDGYNLKALEAGQGLAHGPIEDAIEAILPKDDYVSFSKAAHDKTPREFLETFAEHAALRTKAVKAMTLEEAMAASPKVRAAVTKRDSENYDKGRFKGDSDPGGEPATGDRSGGKLTYAAIQRMTKEQIARIPGDEYLRAIEQAS